MRGDLGGRRRSRAGTLVGAYLAIGVAAACARQERASAGVEAGAEAGAGAGAEAGAGVEAGAEADAGAGAGAGGRAIDDAGAGREAGRDAGGFAEVRAGESIGAVRLGMTKDALVAALGKPERAATKDARDYLYFAGGGLQVALEAGRVKGIFAFSGVAGGYEKATRRYDARGPKGITFESTADQIVLALGVPESRGELSHAPIPSRWLAYPGITFELVKSSGKLVSIAVLPAPARAK